MAGYGPDYVHMYSRAPFYVDRILKGAKPADLPVEGPSKVEFVVNLQAAKGLGLRCRWLCWFGLMSCSNEGGRCRLSARHIASCGGTSAAGGS